MKFVFVILLSFLINVFQGSYGQYLTVKDTSHHVISRQKRWLVWKDGINWMSMIFGIGIPVDLKDESVTLGMTVKAYYEIPNNSSTYTHPSIDIVRKKRSATRWALYETIQGYLETKGYGDGKSCLLKTICEAASIPFEHKSGILAEILHTILIPSSTEDDVEKHTNNEYYAAEQLGRRSDNCGTIFSECDISVLEQFSKLII